MPGSSSRRQFRSETERKYVEALAAKHGVSVEAAQQLLLQEGAAEETAAPTPQQEVPQTPPSATGDSNQESWIDYLPGSGPGPIETFWNWMTGNGEQTKQEPPQQSNWDPNVSLPDETRSKLTQLLQNPPMLSDGTSSAGHAPLKPILDLIGNTEGTDRREGYNETLGYGAYTGGSVNLVGMTLDQVDALQTKMLRHPDNSWNSSAVGRYQIIRTTLRDLRTKLGLKGDELFDAKMQDRLAMKLLEGRGLYKWQAGRLSDEQFMRGLSAEWASLPKADGKGTYRGQRVGSRRQAGPR